MIGGFRSSPETCFGLKVFISPDVPKMQLSARVKEVLSPECISETNAWMLGFFGTENALDDGQVITSQMFGFIQMNPRTYREFRKVAAMPDLQ